MAEPCAPQPKQWTDFSGTDKPLRWVRDAGSQISAQLAFLLPGRDSEHAVNLRVLRRLLGWGGMSRLMLRLRESGLRVAGYKPVAAGSGTRSTIRRQPGKGGESAICP